MFRSAICRLPPPRANVVGSISSSLPWSIHHTLARRRTFSVSPRTRNSSPPATQKSNDGLVDSTDPNLIYNAPLTSTFRRLKIFSLASLSLSCSLAPLIFVIESQLPFFARTCLAGLAVGTSGVSTGLIAWVGRPYVTTLRRLEPEDGAPMGLELITANWRLQTRITRVYDTSFLATTERPFAKWQLADELELPSSSSSSETSHSTITPNSEETVAETFDAKGNVLGSWVVIWEYPQDVTNEGVRAGNIIGKCRGIGRIIK
ncbi:hypothetical protein F5880DRAFT_1482095 [Lentinula raphanica]|nr:hypothetical protein F5880DRAFT_1482095 [Lentinula raphanica]